MFAFAVFVAFVGSVATSGSVAGSVATFGSVAGFAVGARVGLLSKFFIGNVFKTIKTFSVIKLFKKYFFQAFL